MSMTRLPVTGTKAIFAGTVGIGGSGVTFAVDKITGLVAAGIFLVVAGAALVIRFGFRPGRSAGSR